MAGKPIGASLCSWIPFSHVQQECSESAQQQRTVLHKSNQQQQATVSQCLQSPSHSVELGVGPLHLKGFQPFSRIRFVSPSCILKAFSVCCLACRGPKKDVFLPVHLYGQLALHEDGMELLKKEVRDLSASFCFKSFHMSGITLILPLSR